MRHAGGAGDSLPPLRRVGPSVTRHEWMERLAVEGIPGHHPPTHGIDPTMGGDREWVTQWREQPRVVADLTCWDGLSGSRMHDQEMQYT
jgi:hypothetical protein